MKSPLVTIVTPSLNQGSFIRATIESVFSQDYPNLEYIIMDGGSSDETASVAREYASRLTWISEPDRGQAHAINKGFRMAKGEIVSWLNSDDIILPGAVRHAVQRFERTPQLGAVYGEGYQIDAGGTIKSRFQPTEPFNLWKLIYLYDYILQQTCYFRKDVLQDVGFLDERLQWGMDWDVLIRIGKHYQIEHIPEYMGAIREYAAAKSFSGGEQRFRELVQIMRRHGGVRYPPAYIFYGLNTYIPIWCGRIRRYTPRLLKIPSRAVQMALRFLAGWLINRELRGAQGLYPDGWAGPRVKYMLSPGSGHLVVEGTVPRTGALGRGQKLKILCNGAVAGSFAIPTGEFQLAFDVPHGYEKELCSFEIRAHRTTIPALSAKTFDLRRLAYILNTIAWAEPENRE